MTANLGAGGRFRSFSGARHLQMTTDIGTTTVMPARANGTFEVKLSPQPADETGVGRLTIDKQFHGHLEATSKGHMLAYSTEVQGSAGYVALERVTGSVSGRTGTFVPAAQRYDEPRRDAARADGRSGLRNRTTRRARREDGDNDRREEALLRIRVHAAPGDAIRGRGSGIRRTSNSHSRLRRRPNAEPDPDIVSR